MQEPYEDCDGDRSRTFGKQRMETGTRESKI